VVDLAQDDPHGVATCCLEKSRLIIDEVRRGMEDT
jgi:hypothetical protein